MKKLLVFTLVSVSCAALLAQGAGRAVHKPGGYVVKPSPAPQHSDWNRSQQKIHQSDYDRTPSGYGPSSPYSPFSLGIGAFGMPYGSRWTIGGLRLNVSLPGWTTVYSNVYGFDIGFSGESIYETGGVAVNVFNNTCEDFYGVAVAGLWNYARGFDSQALQVAPVLNWARGIDGIQIGLVNIAEELHGVQIGFYNSAVSGTGLQIGVWNNNSSGVGSPILGFVY